MRVSVSFTKELLNQIDRDEHIKFVVSRLENEAGLLAADLKSIALNHIVLFLHVNNELCGFAVLCPNEADRIMGLCWVSVKYDIRGHGYGSKLVRAAKKYTVDADYHTIHALRLVAPFLHKNGFARPGARTRSPFYLPNGFLTCSLHSRCIPMSLSRHIRTAFKFRLANSWEHKGWNQVILAVCDYNVGGTDLLDATWRAQLKIIATPHDDPLNIVALIAMSKEGWIPFFACLPQFQGQGLGSALMYLALEHYRLNGGTVVGLSPLNSKVAGFYEQFGFEFVPLPKGRSSHSVSERVMQVTLSPKQSLLPPYWPWDTLVTTAVMEQPTSQKMHVLVTQQTRMSRTVACEPVKLQTAPETDNLSTDTGDSSSSCGASAENNNVDQLEERKKHRGEVSDQNEKIVKGPEYLKRDLDVRPKYLSTLMQEILSQ